MKAIFLSLVLFGTILSAAPVDVTMQGVGNGATDSTGGYYVGPYTLTINGVATPAMCMDDFLDTNVGSHWQASVTDASGPDFSNTLLGNNGVTIYGYHASSADAYQAEAYLFSLIVKPNADQADIQEAAWFIIDPNNNTYINNSGVQKYLYDAYQNYSSFDASNYSIITDTTGQGNQEFMVASSPEPASFALLGASLLLGGFARFGCRKQAAQPTA